MKGFFLFTCILLFSCTQKEDIESSTNNSASDRATYTLSGKIVWSGDTSQGVGQTVLNLSGPETQTFTTSATGLFTFSISTSGVYTITPSKSINLLNGITTSDVALIQQYISGFASLNSLQIVSADVNKSNTITMADATTLNQAILGNPSAKSILKPSWTFVDRTYSFGAIPPIPTYPKFITVNVNSNVNQIDFIGIKRGDVNASCTPSN